MSWNIDEHSNRSHAPIPTTETPAWLIESQQQHQNVNPMQQQIGSNLVGEDSKVDGDQT